MSQSQTLKISGLYTSVNELSVAPEGALSVADNIDILQPGVAQPRRGFSRTNSGVTDTATAALVEYDGLILAHRGSTVSTADDLQISDQDTSEGAVTAPSNRRIKFAKQNSNLFMTSTTFPKVLTSSTAGTNRDTGGYKGLDITASTSATAATLGWANGDQYSWRHVWKYTDANQNIILGAPSQREVFTAVDSTKGVDLLITVPSGVTTSWVLQIYRSLGVTAASVAAGGTPSDELYLAKELSPSAGEITAGYLTTTDLTPESTLGAVIYTAASQEGLAQGNERPPFAEDLALFSDCLFFGGTVTKYRYILSLTQIGGSAGLVADDTITINGITYTAKASETIASAQFKVTGSSTTAANIEATAKSLVRVINRHASSTVYAYYLSGTDDNPGTLLLEERSIGGAVWGLRTSRATCWSPSNIPSASTYSYATNDSSKSLLMWSKPNQPEHVPLVNSLRVGAKNDPIVRIIALKEALIIFKTSGEVWSITGQYFSFYAEKLADTVKLEAKDSCAVLDNKIFCLTSKGVEVVDTAGASVVSAPIQQDLLELIAADYSDLLETIAFGVGFEAERKYYIFLPSTLSETTCTQAYVLNVATGSWVRHILSASCGLVSSVNKFYLGSSTYGNISTENRNYTFTDYVDYAESSVPVTAISGTTLTVSSGVDTVGIGDILSQGSLFASVTAVNLATSQITISTDPGFSTTTTYISKSIPVAMEWIPQTFGAPGLGKQFSSISLLFKTDILGSATVSFSTDLDQGVEEVTISGRGLSQWGLFAWGDDPWGGEPVRRPLRQWVPRSKQRGSLLEIGFNHSWGYSNWSLLGITVVGELGSEGISRE